MWKYFTKSKTCYDGGAGRCPFGNEIGQQMPGICSTAVVTFTFQMQQSFICSSLLWSLQTGLQLTVGCCGLENLSLSEGPVVPAKEGSIPLEPDSSPRAPRFLDHQGPWARGPAKLGNWPLPRKQISENPVRTQTLSGEA